MNRTVEWKANEKWWRINFALTGMLRPSNSKWHPHWTALIYCRNSNEGIFDYIFSICAVVYNNNNCRFFLASTKWVTNLYADTFLLHMCCVRTSLYNTFFPHFRLGCELHHIEISHSICHTHRMNCTSHHLAHSITPINIINSVLVHMSPNWQREIRTFLLAIGMMMMMMYESFYYCHCQTLSVHINF